MNGLCIAFLLLGGAASRKFVFDVAWMLIAPVLMGWRR